VRNPSARHSWPNAPGAGEAGGGGRGSGIGKEGALAIAGGAR
jgi:hypothetical protein